MRFVIFITFICSTWQALGQTITVNDGFFNMDGLVSITCADLEVDGSIINLDSSAVYLSNSVGGAGTIEFGYLVVEEDVNQLTSFQSNHIVFRENAMLFGNGNSVDLLGSLYDENEEARFVDGEITKAFNPSLGELHWETFGNLGLTFDEVMDSSFTLVRRNAEFTNLKGDFSVLRNYEVIDLEEESSNIITSYFDGELNGVEESLLQPFMLVGGVWEPIVDYEGDEQLNLVQIETLPGNFNITYFVKAAVDLFVPTGFSPNNDGVNDGFEILGLDQYPNSYLQVFDQFGNTIFEAEPYLNNWSGTRQDGSILPSGTYFILFYPDVNDKSVEYSHSIEIRGVR